MTKKVFAIVVTFLMIIFTSSMIFAANTNMGNEWDNSMDKTQNTMHNIGNGVESAVDGVMNMGRNVVNGLTNDNMNENPAYTNDTAGITTIPNQNNDTNTGVTGFTTDNGNNDDNTGYTATRTATNLATTNNSLFGLSDTAWTWIIMIITAAVIVSLVYYYGAQHENTTRVNNKDFE